MTTPDLSRAAWRKSTHSSGGDNCVEVADLNTAIAVRDSKNPDGPPLLVSRHAWSALFTDVKHGRYDW